jgi:hypothetical protein
VCHAALVSNPAKESARRWYKARQSELRDLLWEWDPLGLMGGPVDAYESVEDLVLSALTKGGTDADVEEALRSGLAYMADQGFSVAAAERESQVSALKPVVGRMRTWWDAAPSPPATAA